MRTSDIKTNLSTGNFNVFTGLLDEENNSVIFALEKTLQDIKQYRKDNGLPMECPLDPNYTVDSTVVYTHNIQLADSIIVAKYYENGSVLLGTKEKADSVFLPYVVFDSLAEAISYFSKLATSADRVDLFAGSNIRETLDSAGVDQSTVDYLYEASKAFQSSVQEISQYLYTITSQIDQQGFGAVWNKNSKHTESKVKFIGEDFALDEFSHLPNPIYMFPQMRPLS